MSSLRRRTAQKDVEMHPRPPPSNVVEDDRPDWQHDIEDPYFVADYLAGNTSKAAAVFRRYDTLVIHRLIQLSKDLNSLEEQHDKFVDRKGKSQLKSEDLDLLDFESELSRKIKEYCRKLHDIRMNE